MSDAQGSLGKRLLGNRLFWPVAGLGILLLFNLVFDRSFFELTTQDGHLYGPMISTLRQSVRIMLIAIGMTLVIATGGVDLSVGSVMAVVGASVGYLAAESGVAFPGLLAIGLGVGLLAGAFNGVMISYVGVQPIVATLIMMVLGRGVALNITGGFPIKIENEGVQFFGRGFLFGIPFPILLALAALGVTVFLCRKTASGLFVEAVGDNEVASRFCGVNSSGVKIAVYAFCGVCAAMAGLVAAGDIGRVEPDRLGALLELDAITAVVVGGTALSGGRFSLVGSIIGALLIQTLTVTLIRQGMPSDIAPAPKAVVIIAVCLLQSPKLRGQISRWFPSKREVAS